MKETIYLKHLAVMTAEIVTPLAIGLYASELTGEPYYRALGAFFSALSVPVFLYINGKKMKKEQGNYTDSHPEYIESIF